MSHPIEIFCCQNTNCSHYGIRSEENLSFCGWSGHKKEIRMVRCKICKYRFSERKGTPLFNRKLPKKKAISLYEHLKEGCGLRPTSRLLNITLNTVIRYSKAAGNHALSLHDELVEFSPETKEVQFDEKWSFVKKTTN